MKLGKYFYMGLGAIVALAIGAGAFAFTSSTQAAAGNGFDSVQFMDGGFGDMEHDGPGRGGRDGKRGGGDRDNSALLAELGVTQEEWDAAKAAVKASFADSGERPEKEVAQALFAEELGVTVEQMEAAQEAVREARLADALANGDITQEQIDLMAARKVVAGTVDQKAVMADILGITVEELDAAKEDGTMRDLVEATGLTREEIKIQAEAAYFEAVDQAAADGTITQDQADQLKEAGLGGKGGKGGRGGNGAGRGGNGAGRGGNGNVSTGDA